MYYVIDQISHNIEKYKYICIYDDLYAPIPTVYIYICVGSLQVDEAHKFLELCVAAACCLDCLPCWCVNGRENVYGNSGRSRSTTKRMTKYKWRMFANKATP